MFVKFRTARGEVLQLPAEAGPALRLLAAGRQLLVVCSGPRAGWCAWGSGGRGGGGAAPELRADDVARMSDFGLVGCGPLMAAAGGAVVSSVVIAEEGRQLAGGLLPAGWCLDVDNDARALAAFGLVVSVRRRRGGGVLMISRGVDRYRLDVFSAAGKPVCQFDIDAPAVDVAAEQVDARLEEVAVAVGELFDWFSGRPE